MKPSFELIAGESLNEDFVYLDILVLNNADRQFVQRLCETILEDHSRRRLKCSFRSLRHFSAKQRGSSVGKPSCETILGDHSRRRLKCSFRSLRHFSAKQRGSSVGKPSCDNHIGRPLQAKA
jgi:hypothetical protein